MIARLDPVTFARPTFTGVSLIAVIDRGLMTAWKCIKTVSDPSVLVTPITCWNIAVDFRVIKATLEMDVLRCKSSYSPLGARSAIIEARNRIRLPFSFFRFQRRAFCRPKIRARLFHLSSKPPSAFAAYASSVSREYISVFWLVLRGWRQPLSLRRLFSLGIALPEFFPEPLKFSLSLFCNFFRRRRGYIHFIDLLP